MVRGNYCLRVNVILFLSLSQVETIRREINSVKVTGRERERNRQRERDTQLGGVQYGGIDVPNYRFIQLKLGRCMKQLKLNGQAF